MLMDLYVVLIGRVFIYAVIAFFLIDYFEPRKSKNASFFGYIAFVWVWNLFLSLVYEYTDLPAFGATISELIVFVLVTAYSSAGFLIGLRANFKATVLKNVLITCAIILISSFAEMVRMFLYSNIFGPEAAEGMANAFAPFNLSYAMLEVTALFVFIIVLAVFFRVLKRKNIDWANKSKYSVIILVSLHLLFIFVSLNLLYVAYPLFTFFQIPLIALLITTLVFFVYFINLNNKRHSFELKADYMEKLSAAQSRHIGEIMEQNSRIERLKHDFNTHAKILSDLAETGKYGELKDYLRDFAGKYTLEPLAFCSRGALNAVLSDKYRIAKDANIDIKILFDDSGAENISDIDLCTVVSNLLQNAIEACGRAGSPETGRQIRLSAGAKADVFIITQTNTGTEPADGFKTAKGDASNHGFGLSIIEEIAKKHNGSAKFEYMDGIFTSTALFGG